MIRLQLKQRLADFTLDLDLTLPGRGVTAIVRGRDSADSS